MALGVAAATYGNLTYNTSISGFRAAGEEKAREIESGSIKAGFRFERPLNTLLRVRKARLGFGSRDSRAISEERSDTLFR